MDIIIKKQELENISSLLPTIIYNELLKFTEEPISIEGDVTSPTTESVVETKIDKSVLLIKIKLFKKALEKDKSNKVLKIKIKLFEKELTKYANGGGVEAKISREFSNLKNGVKASYEKLFTEIVDSLESDFDVNRGVAFKKVFNTKNWDKTKKFLNDGYAPNQVAEMFYKGEFGNMKYEEGGMMAKGGFIAYADWDYDNRLGTFSSMQKMKEFAMKNKGKYDEIIFEDEYGDNIVVTKDDTAKDLDYLFSTMAQGGGVGSYKNHKVGDFVEKWGFMGKSKIMKIIGFEDGRKTYILESEDGKSRSYTPKKYIANLSGEFPLMADGGGVGGEQITYVAEAIFNPNQKNGKIKLSTKGSQSLGGLKYLIADLNGEHIASDIFEANQKDGVVKTEFGDKTYGQLLAIIHNAKTNKLNFYEHKKMANGGGVDDFKMSYDEMTTYEKSNHIHYNPMNSRWQVTKNGENKEFWNQEQAEKYAGFEFDDEKDSRYSRKRYEALFGYAKGGGVDYNENREMVLNDNKQIAHHTKELQSAVKGKNVPAWVVAKVNRSASDLSDSTHYMEGQGERFADGGGVEGREKIMELYSQEVSDLRRKSYPKISVSQAVKLASEYMLLNYSKKELKEAINNDRQIQLFGMQNTWLNALNKANKFEGGGVFNGKYLDTISSDKKNKILKNIANNYGFSIAEALAEVVDADAEMLYEYISNDQSLRMSVYNDIEGGKFAKGTSIKGFVGGVNPEYLLKLSNFQIVGDIIKTLNKDNTEELDLALTYYVDELYDRFDWENDVFEYQSENDQIGYEDLVNIIAINTNKSKSEIKDIFNSNIAISEKYAKGTTVKGEKEKTFRVEFNVSDDDAPYSIDLKANSKEDAIQYFHKRITSKEKTYKNPKITKVIDMTPTYANGGGVEEGKSYYIFGKSENSKPILSKDFRNIDDLAKYIKKTYGLSEVGIYDSPHYGEIKKEKGIVMGWARANSNRDKAVEELSRRNKLHWDTMNYKSTFSDKMSNEMYEKLDKITDWKIIKQKQHPLRSKIFLTLSQSGNYYRIAPLSNGKIVNRTATYFTQKELAEKDYESTIKKYFVNDIEGGKFAKGNTVKSGVKKWINPDRISKLEYEIATIKKNAILKKDIQSDADRKRIKEKILKPMEEQLELLKKGIDTPSPFKYD
jgi:hypothetical protein